MTEPESEAEAEALAAAYAAKLAEGPAATWPFGAGTEDDPYYLPDGFALGQDPAEWISTTGWTPP